MVKSSGATRVTKYRSRTDISSAMLEVAQGGAMKTKIMYKAFLSFPQLKEYLELLMENDMLEFKPETRMYYTTEKGVRFLRMYKELGRVLNPRESMIKHIE
jgi:predicted transcriptional regulator